MGAGGEGAKGWLRRWLMATRFASVAGWVLRLATASGYAAALSMTEEGVVWQKKRPGKGLNVRAGGRGKNRKSRVEVAGAFRVGQELA